MEVLMIGDEDVKIQHTAAQKRRQRTLESFFFGSLGVNDRERD